MDKIKVLVVDDKKIIGDLFDITLGFKGHEVAYAGNKAQALEIVGKDEFDLIFLDIILPEESGDNFYVRLKKIPKFKDLKVLTISVLGDESEFFKGIDERAESLAKPIEKERLLTTVKEMIGE